jgi:hypothetical protein
MNKFWKTLITISVVTIVLSMVVGIITAANTSYASHAPVNFIFILVVFAGVAYLAFHGLKRLWMTMAICAIVTLQSCNYAKSNQQVLVSSDCGVTWSKINAGESVPKAGMNPCYMKVVIPNYPMQGDSKFITNLKDRVRAVVHIDYDYSITEPLAFIKQAKYLGKANTDADSEAALDNSAFEGAENMVIDKRIRDVSKEMFLKEDIVDLDQAEIENLLLSEANKKLEPFGVHLNFISLTFDLDEQTRQSIDVSTAMKIYESRGLLDLGKQIMVARAGANKIIVETKQSEN